MADRQVSIRVGRGFWSRGEHSLLSAVPLPLVVLTFFCVGPGPASNFVAEDFPGLQPSAAGADDYAMIFKANLELTQLFSNAHDVLYSNRAREMKLILAGDYVKYIVRSRCSMLTFVKY